MFKYTKHKARLLPRARQIDWVGKFFLEREFFDSLAAFSFLAAYVLFSAEKLNTAYDQRTHLFRPKKMEFVDSNDES